MPSFYLSSWFNSLLAVNPGTAFSRLRTQNLTITDQYISDGIGFETNWIEQSIASEERRFVEFDVPVGFTLALADRFVNTSADDMWYHVYPEGTYTLGAAKANDGTDATGFLKGRNLRDNSALPAPDVSRYNVTSPPTRVIDSVVDEPIWGGLFTGQTIDDKTFFLLSGSQKFLLELYHFGGGTANAQIKLVYALIPNDRVAPIPA